MMNSDNLAFVSSFTLRQRRHWFPLYQCSLSLYRNCHELWWNLTLIRCRAFRECCVSNTLPSICIKWANILNGWNLRWREFKEHALLFTCDVATDAWLSRTTLFTLELPIFSSMSETLRTTNVSIFRRKSSTRTIKKTQWRFACTVHRKVLMLIEILANANLKFLIHHISVATCTCNNWFHSDTLQNTGSTTRILHARTLGVSCVQE